ncbi:MAG: hypothetical protein U1A78_39075 [Polyangia bacterium]
MTLFVGPVLASCGSLDARSGRLKQPIESLDQCLRSRGECLAQLWNQVQGLLGLVNYQQRHKFAELQAQVDWLMCPDESVRNFISRCALDPSSGGSCDGVDTREIVRQLDRYPHKMLYYPLLNQSSAMNPDAARAQVRSHVRALGAARLDQLKKWARDRRLTDKTSLLVMFMPYSRRGKASASTEASEEAGRVAAEVRRYFLDELLLEAHDPADLARVQRLFPREVGCFERNTTLRSYLNRPENLPIGNEPKEGQPRTVIWLFLLDCAPPRPEKQGS